MKPKPRNRKEKIGDILFLLSRMPLLFVISFWWKWMEHKHGPGWPNEADWPSHRE